MAHNPNDNDDLRIALALTALVLYGVLVVYAILVHTPGG